MEEGIVLNFVQGFSVYEIHLITTICNITGTEEVLEAWNTEMMQ